MTEFIRYQEQQSTLPEQEVIFDRGKPPTPDGCGPRICVNNQVALVPEENGHKPKKKERKRGNGRQPDRGNQQRHQDNLSIFSGVKNGVFYRKGSPAKGDRKLNH
ncbi:hypothetical protein A2773_02185 [Candidatus Gottesmanbacteria bacterium RIFCSPHIGHO2_01_FULL_39_10]|uniref:Uncharacterized protein n=1 Tax=Candidatus Gottesmanbacteria bacterium RIFCSPHIGHO2_01_FULL_39_10 TaxID=1798375 RepID=A0A1F5ZQB6_9BACT|nr:MAG: hypothetical protein A2773_02185 [Candidatus Gottesmanbacteria bacterium RIFCSPHIGHO2_01_FULL_39_10]